METDHVTIPTCNGLMATKGTEIRESIQILMSILSACGVPRIPSESIRQAKFNQPSATRDLLHLLYFTCQLMISPAAAIRLHTPATTTTLKILEERWMLLFVQRHLYSHGYTWFFTCCDSRELLLSLGWLVIRYDIVAKLRDVRSNALNSSLIQITPSIDLLLRKTQVYLSSLETQLHTAKKKLETGQLDVSSIQGLSWLRGRLNKEWTIVSRLVDTHRQLVYKLQKYTSAKDHQPLSLQELYLLRYTDRLKEYIRETDKELSFLQLCLDWETKARPVVNHWLKSVLELAEKERDREETDLATLKKEIDSLKVSVSVIREQKRPLLERLETHYTSSQRKIPSEELERILSHAKNTILVNCINQGSEGDYKQYWKSVICSAIDTERNPSDEFEELVEELRETNKTTRDIIDSQLRSYQERMSNTITIMFQ